MTIYCHQFADLQVEAEKRRHWDAWAKLHTSNEAMALVLGGASIQTFIIMRPRSPSSGSAKWRDSRN